MAGSFTLQSKLRINSKTNHQREFLSLTLSVTGMVFKLKKKLYSNQNNRYVIVVFRLSVNEANNGRGKNKGLGRGG